MRPRQPFAKDELGERRALALEQQLDAARGQAQLIGDNAD
jgi:hypothetical protein